MFESKREKLLTQRQFFRRMAGAFGLAGVVLVVSLMIGIAGYHWLAGFGWVDAILNASMILGGMGPVDAMPTDAAKLFASGYALFSGVALISLMAIVLGPIAHRLLHKFHIDDEDFKDV